MIDLLAYPERTERLLRKGAPPAPLTARTLQVLRFIHDYNQEHGYPPCIREIQEALSIRGSADVQGYIKRLESGGYLVRPPRIQRATRITTMGYQALRLECNEICPHCGHALQAG